MCHIWSYLVDDEQVTLRDTWTTLAGDSGERELSDNQHQNGVWPIYLLVSTRDINLEIEDQLSLKR